MNYLGLWMVPEQQFSESREAKDEKEEIYVFPKKEMREVMAANHFLISMSKEMLEGSGTGISCFLNDVNSSRVCNTLPTWSLALAVKAGSTRIRDLRVSSWVRKRVNKSKDLPKCNGQANQTDSQQI